MIEMIVDSIRVSMMNYQRVVILKEEMTDRYLPIWIGSAEADAIAVKLQGVAISRPLTHDLLNSIVDALGATVNSIIVSDLKNDTFFAKIVLNVGQRHSVSEVREYIDTRVEDGVEREYKMISLLWGVNDYQLEVIREWQESGRRFVRALEQKYNFVAELSCDGEELVWSIGELEIDSRPSDAIALAVRVEAPIYVEEVVLDKAGIVLDKETGKPVSEEKGEGKTAGKKVSEEEIKGMSAFRDFFDTLDLDDFDKRKS